MPKKGHLKDGFFLFYKGHHLKPLSRWLKENKVKNMEENRMLQVIRRLSYFILPLLLFSLYTVFYAFFSFFFIYNGFFFRGIFQGLRTLYQKHKRGHGDLGSEIIEGVAIKEDGHVVLWNLSNKLDEIHADTKGDYINYGGIIHDLDHLRGTIFSRDVRGKLQANDGRSFPIETSPIKYRKRYGEEMKYLYNLLAKASTSLVKDTSVVEFILCSPLCWTPEDRIKFTRASGYLSKNYDLKNDSNFEKHIGTTKLSDWAIKTRSLIHKADAPNQVLAAVFAFSAVGKKNIFSQEVISYCGSPLKQIPRAYSQVGSIAEFPRNFRDNFRGVLSKCIHTAGQFTDHQILGFIESAFPRLWCVLHEGLMRAMCVTESEGIISPATFTAIACPWSVRDILTHCIFDPN